MEKMIYPTKSGQAHLAICEEEETYYVALTKDATVFDLEEIDALLERFNLEMMDEDECPSVLIFGNRQVWCAKKDGRPSLLARTAQGSRWQD